MFLEQFKLILQQRGNNRIIEELRNGKVYAYEKIQDCLTQVQAKGRTNEGRVFYSDVNLQWGIAYLDISDVDLHNIELNKFLRIPFSNITKWPSKEKLPKGFNPNKIIEKSKSFKGVGIEKVNDEGIKGDGVVIAYIDTPFNINHVEFNGLKTDYVSKFDEFEFHGSAVIARAVGQNIGVAPNARLLYYEHDYKLSNNGLEVCLLTFVNALKDILRRLKNGERIDIIGVSASPRGWINALKNSNVELAEKCEKEAFKLLEEIKRDNVAYLDADVFMDSGFDYAFMVNASNDNNDINNYHRRFRSTTSKAKDDVVCVIDGGKCRPCHLDVKNYIYENVIGSASWSIPQVVGLFALGRQIDKNITFDKFVEFSHKTAHEKNNYDVKLINARALVKQIQKEFSNTEV